jgi:hypothetical protein
VIPGGFNGETGAARALRLDRLVPARPVYAVFRSYGVSTNVIPLAQVHLEVPACGHADEVKMNDTQGLPPNGFS